MPNSANRRNAFASARISLNALRLRMAMMGRNSAADPSMRIIVMNRLEMA